MTLATSAQFSHHRTGGGDDSIGEHLVSWKHWRCQDPSLPLIRQLAIN